MKYGFQEKNNVKSFFVTLNKKTSTSVEVFFKCAGEGTRTPKPRSTRS